MRRKAMCPLCKKELAYDGHDEFQLNAVGRDMWKRKGPPRCVFGCGAKMIEVWVSH